MDIPNWVDAKTCKKSQINTARLRYIMNVIAAKHTGGSSLRALAERIKMDHSTLSLYVRRGRFSEPAAKKINKLDNDVPVSWLTNPENIEVSPPA